jgi:hypothetical protein
MSEGNDEDSPSRPLKVLVDHANPVQPSPGLSKIAPVIVSAIDKPGFFLSLKFADTKSFVDDLAHLVKPVKNVEVASGGDLFVFPFDLEQKQAILKLNYINNLEVSCKLTKSESEFRGVIVGVPVSESDSEALLDLLKDQHVTHVHRVNKFVDGVQSPSTVVVLTFSQPFPYRVRLGYRSFVVRAYSPKPMQCSKCHRIGHTVTHCNFPARCPSCGGSHPPAANCESKAKCLNCQKDLHLTGSPLCPAYISHSNALKFARANNVSIFEAKQRLSTLRSPTQTPHSASGPAAPSAIELAQQKEIDSLHLKVKLLDSKLSKLVINIQPLFTLQSSVEKIVDSFAAVHEKIETLSGIPGAIQGLQNQISEMATFMKSVNVSPSQSQAQSRFHRTPYDKSPQKNK